jgi:hypothetical protein
MLVQPLASPCTPLSKYTSLTESKEGRGAFRDGKLNLSNCGNWPGRYLTNSAVASLQTSKFPSAVRVLAEQRSHTVTTFLRLTLSVVLWLLSRRYIIEKHAVLGDRINDAMS